MKDITLNVPGTLDIARYAPPWKIIEQKSRHQSSVFYLNQTKITYSTENDIFNGQARWILI